MVGKPAEILSSLQGISIATSEKPRSLTQEVFNRELTKLQVKKVYDLSREILIRNVDSPPQDLTWEGVGVYFNSEDTSGALCNVSIDFSSYPDHEIHKEPEVSINVSNGCMIASAKIKKRDPGDYELRRVFLKGSDLRQEPGFNQIINLLEGLKDAKGSPKYPKSANSWDHARVVRGY